MKTTNAIIDITKAEFARASQAITRAVVKKILDSCDALDVGTVSVYDANGEYITSFTCEEKTAPERSGPALHTTN